MGKREEREGTWNKRLKFDWGVGEVRRQPREQSKQKTINRVTRILKIINSHGQIYSKGLEFEVQRLVLVCWKCGMRTG